MKTKFTPIPDPRRGEVSDLNVLKEAKTEGAIPRSIIPFGGPSDFLHQMDGVTPPSDEGDGKWWRDASAQNDTDPNKVFEYIFWNGNTMEVKNLRHSPSAAIYGMHTVMFYEWYANKRDLDGNMHFSNGVPELVVLSMPASEAYRLNFAKNSQLPYPLRSGKEFFTDRALRLNPKTKLLESFSQGEFKRDFPPSSQWNVTKYKFSEILKKVQEIESKGGADEQKLFQFESFYEGGK